MQNGTPIAVLQELGGWRDMKMVLRYAHLSPSHLAPYAANSGLDPTQHEENIYEAQTGHRARLQETSTKVKNVLQ